MMKSRSGLAACTLALSCACTAVTSTSAEAERIAAFDLQGHRGGRGLRPENTLAGFTWALELGVRTLELDCAVTRDGVVVVSHDSSLNPDITRDSSGKFLEEAGRPLHTLTVAELQQYDVGRLRPGSEYGARFPEQQPVDGERIPRLADVYALVEKSGNREVRFNIETKLDPLQPELTALPAPFVAALLGV
ncbi:MAG: glycerophosphodiester phosphodiesterase family protein, partial [Steroidobacteraceae bacterium]